MNSKKGSDLFRSFFCVDLDGFTGSKAVGIIYQFLQRRSAAF